MQSLLTVEQVAERLHCSPLHVRQLVRDGHIEAALIGSRYLVPEAELDAFITARTGVKRKTPKVAA
jgi:excisionase family DNA binding protein